ncbi:alpha-1-antitrypsin-like [Engystomops pustulosus]|uniref:alpha-1-antitrypsin-like n=1 Tax=Engystomops pustulosus TaxID=76066 RepID=UPI003AFAD21C
MRVFVFFGVTLLFVLAFADHHKGHNKDNKDDHHDHKDDHDDHDHHDHKDEKSKTGEHHDKMHHHHHNESLPCHKIAPYNSKFAFDLYRQVALDHPSENIVFSPVSISTAFAFLSLGAKAQTHKQIIEALSFNTSEISEEDIHKGFHHLLHLLNDVDRELKLSGGNALFISKEHKILQTFLDEAKTRYHSEAFSTDFKNTEEAKKQINSYVEKNTQGKIADLLDSIDQDAIFVLINYIYFKAKWENPFNSEWTKEGDFHVNENTTVKASFMSRTGMYNVAFNDDATVISIPYKGGANALFILPNEGKLSEVENNFNTEKIKIWKKSMHKRLVDLLLPKFSISGTINLKETLTKMGLVDVFSNTADLSGITGDADSKISKAIHKAAISVNEKGTEAAAVTALEIIPMMLPPRINFSRPFIISVYDHKSKSILFNGRIVNPQK